MSLAWKTLQTTVEESSCYVAERASLDLPQVNYTVPLSPCQQEALDLAISNSPIALIAGNPGSGKTRLGYQALVMATQFQKSTLLVTYHPNTLNAYEALPLRPILLNQQSDYAQSIVQWLREQLAQATLAICPPALLDDPLFAKLQTQPNYRSYLDLIRLGKTAELIRELKTIFSDISPARLNLLGYRLQKSLELLEKKEILLNHYQNLSDQGVTQLAEATIVTAKIPILGTMTDVLNSELRFQQFDFILVEDSHYFSQVQLMAIARMTNKLILLGENNNNRSYFSRIFKKVSPAYRVSLSENFRLNPSLAYLIFPHLYQDYPYSPLQTYIPWVNRLRWFDVPVNSSFKAKILEFLTEIASDLSIGLLCFSKQSRENLIRQIPELLQQDNLTLHTVEDWIGRECDVLLIICDGVRPTYTQLCLALTRAKEVIACFGDYSQYERSAFSILFKQQVFHWIKEVAL